MKISDLAESQSTKTEAIAWFPCSGKSRVLSKKHSEAIPSLFRISYASKKSDDASLRDFSSDFISFFIIFYKSRALLGVSAASKLKILGFTQHQ